MSAVACCEYHCISSIGLEERPLTTHTNTASEIITGLGACKGTQALASGIIPVQGKLAFCGAKAICNADPTEGGGRKRHTNQTVVYVTRGSQIANALRTFRRSAGPERIRVTRAAASLARQELIQSHHVLSDRLIGALSGSGAPRAVGSKMPYKRYQIQRSLRDAGSAVRERGTLLLPWQRGWRARPARG